MNNQQCNKPVRTKLVFPAFWLCSAPYLSVPSLIAYLLREGFDVTQIDLSLEFLDKMLSKEFLELCIERRLTNINIGSATYSRNFEQVTKYVAENIEECKNTFRSEKALDLKIYSECRKLFSTAFAIIESVFPGERIWDYEYKSNYTIDSFKSIMEAADHAYWGKKDTLVSVLTSYFLDDIILDTEVVGISLTGLDQIIPSFVLAALIRKKAPDIKIVLGGSVPTRWFSEHNRVPDIFKYFDYVIVNEGEIPLAALLSHLQGEISIDEVPQLFYKIKQGQVMHNSLPIYDVDVNSLPTPVFNKLDYKRYLSPVPTLPLLASRGCYWGKCAFCDHSFAYNNGFRARTAEKIVDDIATYEREYGVKHINFHDEAMTPKGIFELSKLILERGVNIKWSTDARLDKSLGFGILETAKRAGLSLLFFGLESINERILKLMNKGTQAEVITNILSDAKKVGIWTHLFFICGFPTETLAEYKETVSFIKNNKDIIASHGGSFFSLSRYSPIALNPDKYSVRITDTRDVDHAALDLEFERIGEVDTYETEMKEAREEINKSRVAYAQTYSQRIFREHWIIFWDKIASEISTPIKDVNEYTLNQALLFIEAENSLLVFNGQNSEVYEFDKSAGFVFDLIDKYGYSKQKDIAYEAAQHYSISEVEASVNIAKFIELLKEKQLLERNEANNF